MSSVGTKLCRDSQSLKHYFTRMQLEFNKLDQSAIDIFSDMTTFQH